MCSCAVDRLVLVQGLSSPDQEKGRLLVHLLILDAWLLMQLPNSNAMLLE
jgi:hypothetical protein